jgi:5-methyltetrahydrofolate--homocysteine methyltransferase
MPMLPEIELLDGAMGTELFAKGLRWGELPERWILERPEDVGEVHAAHASAGAELVLSCTFNLASPRLAAAGIETSVGAIAQAAVDVARRHAPHALLAGSVGPTGLVTPRNPNVPRVEVERWYAAAAGALSDAGVDLLWVESQWSLEEATIALSAMRTTDLPVVLTLSPPSTELTRPGALGPALRSLVALGASAVGVNCTMPDAPLAEALREVGELGVPLVVRPSAGLPGALASPEAFAQLLVELRAAGARWLGGCCGVSPEHLRRAKVRLDAAGSVRE